MSLHLSWSLTKQMDSASANVIYANLSGEARSRDTWHDSRGSQISRVYSWLRICAQESSNESPPRQDSVSVTSSRDITKKLNYAVPMKYKKHRRRRFHTIVGVDLSAGRWIRICYIDVDLYNPTAGSRVEIPIFGHHQLTDSHRLND